MDIIELAREIGRKIQSDERYINMNLAKENADKDKELQDIIGEFNLKRIAINTEAQKKEPDKEKIDRLNEELRSAYNKMAENKNMKAYNDAQIKVTEIINAINVIISKSLMGENPDTIDPSSENCAGDCSSCGGCN